MGFFGFLGNLFRRRPLALVKKQKSLKDLAEEDRRVNEGMKRKDTLLISRELSSVYLDRVKKAEQEKAMLTAQRNRRTVRLPRRR